MRTSEFSDKLKELLLAELDAEIETPTQGVYVSPSEPKEYVSKERIRTRLDNLGIPRYAIDGLTNWIINMNMARRNTGYYEQETE